jgi:metal-responsive CopG/Arc/MetJ family transcriptional regulator
MRTIIEVPEEVIKNLDQVGKQQRKSRAAIIREAICLYLDQKDLKDSAAAFGVWKKRRKDGLEYQEQVRSDWS